MKKIYIAIAALLMSSIISSSAFASETARDPLAAMKKISENEHLELFMNTKDAALAVRVKNSGDIWYTNPPDAAHDPLASSYNKNHLASQFSIRYYNKSSQSFKMDSYNDSVAKGQFESEITENGVCITYTLGEIEASIILPRVISEERFNIFLDEMDETTQREIKRQYQFMSLDTINEKDRKARLDEYPSLELHNIYVLRASVSRFKRIEIMELFADAGYTKADYEYDNTENSYQSTVVNAYFVIPVYYELNGENFIVRLVPEKIVYEETFPLSEISLLEFFGAASTEEEGYIFVPDGSGALIRLNNGKSNEAAYKGTVYGQDKTYMQMYKPDYSHELAVKLPVFGLKTEQKAFFAVIEDGDAMASICADVSGRINSYNNVNASFIYRHNGPLALGNMVGGNSFQMYLSTVYDGEYKVRYAFLTGKEADYSGMANYYRDYLAKKSLIFKNEVKDNMPFFTAFTGAIEKMKNFLGIRYTAPEPLTTYKQAKKITEELIGDGVGNIKVQYSGWFNGGVGSTAASRVRALSAVSKELSLDAFLSYMQNNDVTVYHDVSLQYVYQDKLFDGFSNSKYSPRYFDKSLVYTGRYNIPTGFLMGRVYMISPYFINDIAGAFVKNSVKYNLSGISIRNLTNELYSDFMDKRSADRQQAKNYNAAAIGQLKDAGYGLMGNHANAYAFPYLSDIVNVPMSSNRYRIFDEDVPFYQMAIRGYLEYAGEPLNLAYDRINTLLKTIETGAGLYYHWIYEDNSLIKETDYDYLYSADYRYQIDEAAALYQELNAVFAGLQGQAIIKHEKLLDGVNRTTYENGTSIIVNYNQWEVIYGDISIAPKSYMVRE